MEETEIELTYLARRLPPGLDACSRKEILDIYIPKSGAHPTIRIRRSGNSFMITKKIQAHHADATVHTEHTILLSETEYAELASLEGKRLCKTRYEYPYDGRRAEVDVFHDALEGLVMIDFEFASTGEKEGFIMPDFCLADVTNELILAGGMLCGKKYDDIKEVLAGYRYEKIR